jgi:hypothetical protein
MNRKKRKTSLVTMLFFGIGLVLYLTGIILLFSSSLKKIPVFRAFFSNVDYASNALDSMKLTGGILFFVGFVLFLVSVVFLYKNNEVKDSNRSLIIEGKADVITIIVMTYVMIFMIVVCLLFEQIIGAVLFGLAIIIQTIVNSLLIKYYSREFSKK